MGDHQRPRRSLRTYRGLLGTAAFILLVTGMLHASGQSALANTVEASGLEPEWGTVFRGLWLLFSIHLAILAALVTVLAVRPGHRLVLAAATAFPIADTILLLVIVGVFPGSIMLGLVAALLLLGIVTLPPSLP